MGKGLIRTGRDRELNNSVKETDSVYLRAPEQPLANLF